MIFRPAGYRGFSESGRPRAAGEPSRNRRFQAGQQKTCRQIPDARYATLCVACLCSGRWVLGVYHCKVSRWQSTNSAGLILGPISIARRPPPIHIILGSGLGRQSVEYTLTNNRPCKFHHEVSAACFVVRGYTGRGDSHSEFFPLRPHRLRKNIMAAMKKAMKAKAKGKKAAAPAEAAPAKKAAKKGKAKK